MISRVWAVKKASGITTRPLRGARACSTTADSSSDASRTKAARASILRSEAVVLNELRTGTTGDSTKISLVDLFGLGEFAWLAFRYHAALGQNISVVGDSERLVHVLLHEKDGNATFVDLADDVEILLDEKWRQAERGLVDQQQLRRPHQAPADRDHRLLAARHGASELHPALGQSRKQAKDFRHALLSDCL